MQAAPHGSGREHAGVAHVLIHARPAGIHFRKGKHKRVIYALLLFSPVFPCLQFLSAKLLYAITNTQNIDMDGMQPDRSHWDIDRSPDGASTAGGAGGSVATPAISGLGSPLGSPLLSPGSPGLGLTGSSSGRLGSSAVAGGSPGRSSRTLSTLTL